MADAISRRAFLAAAGLAAGGVAVAAVVGSRERPQAELADRIVAKRIDDPVPGDDPESERWLEADPVLVQLVRTIVRLAILAAPFIPGKVAEIWSSLDFVPVSRNSPGWPVGNVFLSDLAKLAVGGRRVSKPTPLFPKPDSV